MKIVLNLIFAYVVVAPICANADIYDRKRGHFNQFDANADGLLSSMEYTEMIKQEFVNKGKTEDHVAEAAKRLGNKDINRDGYLAFDEILQDMVKRGVLTPAEARFPSASAPSYPTDRPSHPYPAPAYSQPRGAGETLYWQWANSHGLVKGVNDPDGDGLPNLMEYALGGDPNVRDREFFMPESTSIPVGDTMRNVYVYRRRRDAQARGLNYIVETKGYGAGQTPFELETRKIDNDFELVKVLVPKNSELQLRVRID
jgi:hypothetical protein